MLLKSEYDKIKRFIKDTYQMYAIENFNIRTQKNYFVRFAMISIIKKNNKLTLQNLAYLFHNTHTSIINALEQSTLLYQTDRAFKLIYDDISDNYKQYFTSF